MCSDGTNLGLLCAWPPRRSGSAFGNALIACSLLGTFLVTAVVVTPMTLQAAGGESAPATVQARNDANQRVVEHLASLIGRSDEIIAVHHQGETPYTEFVLRLHRENGPMISADEIAVLSHSEILRTLTLYQLIDDPKPDSERARIFRDSAMTVAQQRRRVSEPGFCNLWRSDPSIRPRIIAAGVTDMNIEIIERIDSDHVRLWIELTWGSDSSDENDVASVLLNAAMRE